MLDYSHCIKCGNPGGERDRHPVTAGQLTSGHLKSTVCIINMVLSLPGLAVIRWKSSPCLNGDVNNNIDKLLITSAMSSSDSIIGGALISVGAHYLKSLASTLIKTHH